MPPEDRGKSVHPTQGHHAGTDLDGAVRLAAGKGLTEEDIEAAIQATILARQTKRTRSVPLIREGSRSASASAADGVRMGGAQSLLLVDTDDSTKRTRSGLLPV